MIKELSQQQPTLVMHVLNRLLFLKRIQLIINSTPIGFRGGAKDFITRLHLLHGHKRWNTTELNYLDPPTYFKKRTGKNLFASMDKLDEITKDFWRIYYCKYIQKMSEFSKWKFKDDENKTPNVGDVVGMLDYEQPSGHFGLAVVSKVHPSKDGEIRKISIQTCRPSIPGHP
jgi:hypothetical protein